MNWLAHLLLSDPTPAFRLGGILPDFASSSALTDLPPEFQRGVHRHRQIDAYTDAHPVFRRSVQRFEPPLRRFGGILIDIFYDHFVSREWTSLSDVPLSDFLAEVYASIESHRADLPEVAYHRLVDVQTHNYLGSYGSMEGLTRTLDGLGHRFRRPVDLVPAMAVFQQHYAAFQSDFRSFFPDLCAQVLPASKRPLSLVVS